MIPGFYTACLPSLRPEEAIAEAAALGYLGIEWRVAERPDPADPGPPHHQRHNRCTLPPETAAAERIARLSDAAGVSVIGLAPYLAVGDLDGLRAALDLARACGARHVRLWGSRRLEAGYHAAFAETLAFLRAAEPLARRAGLMLAIETHQDTICPSAELTLRLIADFDPAVVGVIYDIGNMAVEGYADHRIGAALIGARIVNVHIKNVVWVKQESGRYTREWSPCDEGVADIPRALAALREAGYAGWVCLEDFSAVRDDRAKLRHARDLMRAWL
jgi:sugar phosphate isomerase/epimerase